MGGAGGGGGGGGCGLRVTASTTITNTATMANAAMSRNKRGIGALTISVMLDPTLPSHGYITQGRRARGLRYWGAGSDGESRRQRRR